MVAALVQDPIREATTDIIRQTREDPVWFIDGLLGGNLWAMQRKIARALFGRPGARVAVKACHASGKTYLAARLVLSFFYAYPFCKVLTTAPGWMSVEKLLWAELHTAHAKLPAHMGGELLDTELRAGKDWWVLGLSTNDSVRFQGHHASKMLIVVDEAPGLDPGIWEAIEGIRAGGDVRVLMLGNPTIPSGPFYDAFTTQRSGWQTFTIDAFDTPNLAGLTLGDLLALPDEDLDRNERPYLVTRRWVKEKWEEWGDGNPLWLARVRGDFPVESDDSLISLAWLESAKHALLEPTDDDEWAAGVDVAGPGESETVVYVRHGGQIVAHHAWTKPDPRGETVAFLAPWKDRLTVNVDEIGIGHYFVLALRDAGFKVTGINVGEAPRNTEKYANLKAELYWGLRQRFVDGDIAGLADDVAIGQLAGLRYTHNARGQVVIESKEAARKRGVKSPDRAEAIMLAFAKRASRKAAIL